MEDEERQQTATITVLATPEQAMLLTRYENEGVLHVALVSRGNGKLAEELLERQSGILAALYGDGTELPDGELEPSMDVPGQADPDDGGRQEGSPTDTGGSADAAMESTSGKE